MSSKISIKLKVLSKLADCILLGVVHFINNLTKLLASQWLNLMNKLKDENKFCRCTTPEQLLLQAFFEWFSENHVIELFEITMQ